MQQAEEREREESKTQDEAQHGDDGTDRTVDVLASRDGCREANNETEYLRLLKRKSSLGKIEHLPLSQVHP